MTAQFNVAVARRRTRAAFLASAALLALSPSLARADLSDQADLSRFSIEELGQIEITSVSKHAEPINHAASAVYVITNDDIRRSGALSLPEALRLAPNLEVARIDALDYSITARGFGGFEAANKLLVLIDGRSVYTPLYSGVDWDQQHVLLDDVDRIEVISGPGGTLWGANAVNGVINVTSRSAEDTQGMLVGGALGTLDSDIRLRYGGRLGATAFRVYGMAFKHGDLRTAADADAKDGWDGGQVGFRADWSGDRDAVTLQGDAHDSAIDESLGAAGSVRGGNLLGRWTRQVGGGSVEVQAYYDRAQREARLVFDAVDAWDLQVQHTLPARGAHALVWGGGYRVTEDDFHLLGLGGGQLLTPGSRQVSVASLFAQDQITLRDDLTLTLGVKIEDNSFTKPEALPSVRLAWQRSDRQLLWAAVSRAVRSPSRIERDFAIPGITIPGRFQSETLVAYEAGYRGRPFDQVSLSASLFYNRYDDLRTNDLITPGTFPGYVGNSLKGETYGAELWGDYTVRDWWRLSAGLTALHKDFELKPGSLDVSRQESEGVDPDAWVKARSQMKLNDTVDFDLSLRAYDDVPVSQASGYVGAPGYVEADARLAWRARQGLELSLSGANLLHDRHPEASEARRNEIPRSVYVGLSWRY
ncbi:MAG: TonB-dependent receptor [Caulobacter sp.]|nr:TonB-dependent receptor [Caulobacter sp.]